MPPMNCERAVLGLMIRPAANTPSRRGTRTSPVSASTRDLGELRAEGVPRVARACAVDVLGRVARSTLPSPPRRAARAQRLVRRAEPHDAMPIEPPATPPRGSALSPISTRDPLGGTLERVGGDLGQHRPRAGADVGRRRSRTVKRAVRVGRARWPARGARVRRIGRRRRRRCRSASCRRGARRPRVAARPAEALGALAQARDEVAELERLAALRVDARARCGCAARPGRARRRRASSSMRGLEREHARRTRRARASTTASGTSSATSRCVVRAVGRGVHHARRRRRLLGELRDGRASARRRRARSRSAARRRRRRAARAGSSASGSRRARTSAGASARA